ncbi:MAG: DUF2490 domain-containing protein [Vicinamibacterales bacterium]
MNRPKAFIPTATLVQVASLIAILHVLAPAPLAAQGRTVDAQLWSPTTVVKTVSDRWFVQAETQVRLTEDFGKLSNSFLRPAVGIRVGRHATVHLGYAWVPYFSPRRDEHRIWQQIAWSLPAGAWTLAPRLRLEQRWLPGADGTTWRLRGQLQVSHALSRSGAWRLSVADELLVFLNDTRLGPDAGFGTNRVRIGFGHRLNRHVTIEPGYVLQFSHGRVQNEIVHAAIVSTSLGF